MSLKMVRLDEINKAVNVDKEENQELSSVALE